MQYERTIKTLEKAGFVVARDVRDSYMNPGTKYENGFTAQVPNGTHYVQAYRNGHNGDTIATMRVIRIGDHDDSQSDYFAGSFVDTVKRAIALAGRPLLAV